MDGRTQQQRIFCHRWVHFVSMSDGAVVVHSFVNEQCMGSNSGRPLSGSEEHFLGENVEFSHMWIFVQVYHLPTVQNTYPQYSLPTHSTVHQTTVKISSVNKVLNQNQIDSLLLHSNNWNHFLPTFGKQQNVFRRKHWIDWYRLSFFSLEVDTKLSLRPTHLGPY